MFEVTLTNATPFMAYSIEEDYARPDHYVITRANSTSVTVKKELLESVESVEDNGGSGGWL